MRVKSVFLYYCLGIVFSTSLAWGDGSSQVFIEEPWYMSNPVSKIVLNLFEAGFNLVRLDRLALDQDGSYIQPLSQSVGDAFGHTVGVLPNFANDFSRAINRIEASIQGYVPAEGVLQCTSFLPIAANLSILQAATQMKHSWIQVDENSYGMPYPFYPHVISGPAEIARPDPFVAAGKVKGVVCTPILQPENEDKIQFRNDYKCIADRLSVADSHPGLQIEYNAFDNNCVAAARYLTECAGGRLTQSPNFAIGTSLNWDDPVIEVIVDSEKVALYTPLIEKIYLIKQEYFPYLKKIKNLKSKALNQIFSDSEWGIVKERVIAGVNELVDLYYARLGTYDYKDAFNLKSFFKGQTKTRNVLNEFEKHIADLKTLGSADVALLFLNTALTNLNNVFINLTYKKAPSTYRAACQRARQDCGILSDIKN